MAKENVNKSTTSSVKDFGIALIKTQVIIIVLAFVVVLSVGTFMPTFWAQLIATIFGIYIYFSFFYSHAWSNGERDRNLVLYNHINHDPLKGLKAGLISVAPLFVLSILEVFRGYTNLLPDWYILIFNICTSPFVLITTKLQESNLYFLEPLICIIPPIFSWIGFRHGYNLKEPFLRFIYVNPNKKKTNYHSRNGKKKAADPTVNKVVTAATVQRPGANNVTTTSTVKKLPVKKNDGEKKLRSR